LFSGERIFELLGLRVIDSRVEELSPLRRELKLAFEQVNEFEAPLVRWIVLKTDRPTWRKTSHIVNQLGNGWIYLALALVTLALLGPRALRPDFTALTAVGVSYLVYFPLKRLLGRVRPCDWDPALGGSVKALDIYSCPSGHCMTITAVGSVFSWVFPQVLPLAIGAIFVMGWTRLVLAHHYLSDLIVGAAIGATIAVVLCQFFLR